jgi:PIN domain nuclease of toxin-antitoxin system
MGGDEAVMVVADTHALVWQLTADAKIGRRARSRLERALAREELCVSAVSFWEIALLVTRDRLRLDSSATHFRWRVLEMGIRELAVGGEVALHAATLAPVLDDPVDCFVAATALTHGATLLTADTRLLESRVVDVLDARR